LLLLEEMTNFVPSRVTRIKKVPLIR